MKCHAAYCMTKIAQATGVAEDCGHTFGLENKTS